MKKIKLKKIRLLLIEDNCLLREGINAMLKSQRDIKIIAASGSSEDTISKISQLKPNVILLDIGLRSQNSLRIVEIVKKEFPKAKVIVWIWLLYKEILYNTSMQERPALY